MKARYTTLEEVGNGGLIMSYWFDAPNFGIKSTIGDTVYITFLDRKFGNIFGPYTISKASDFKIVDLYTDWIVDFDPTKIVLSHDGTPPLGSLLVTEGGEAILCNVDAIGMRPLLLNGEILDQDGNLPYVREWDLLLPSHSHKYRKVFSWPIPDNEE